MTSKRVNFHLAKMNRMTSKSMLLLETDRTFALEQKESNSGTGFTADKFYGFCSRPSDQNPSGNSRPTPFPSLVSRYHWVLTSMNAPSLPHSLYIPLIFIFPC